MEGLRKTFSYLCHLHAFLLSHLFTPGNFVDVIEKVNPVLAKQFTGEHRRRTGTEPPQTDHRVGYCSYSKRTLNPQRV